MSDDRALRRQLAMGLGRGWLGALDRGRDAVDSVISLVLADPRIDRQVEQRDVYYATLLLALGADLSPLIAGLDEVVAEPSDGWLRRGALGELARRGVAEARAALEAVAHRDEGARLELELLEPPEPTPRKAARHTYAPRPPADLLSLRALLEREALRTTSRTREESAAYREALRAIDDVPAEIGLPWARGALDEPWPVSLGAQRVLERHATEDDHPAIEARAAAALAASAHYPLCSFVDALGTIGSAASIPVLVEIYERSPYSYVRGKVLGALAPHASDPRAAALFRESLWDADLGARAEAAWAADAGDPVVRARLEALAEDDAESPDVREAARDRLR